MQPRILIVDDSDEDGFILTSRIRGFAPRAQFLRVNDAEGMREALAGSRWDLVVSDHSMPRFDSTGALRVLRESGQDIPFILYSGCLDEGRGAEAMRVGAHDWISKNDPARLQPVIERELRNCRLRREKDRAERSALELAKYDALTRLPNRTLFTELVQLRLTEPGAAENSPSVLYIDLDRFMRVNDSIGYAAGDGLIRQVAARLRAAAPPGSVLARLGQDEFALFFASGDDVRGPSSAAERLAQRFQEPLTASGQEFYLTLSVGIAEFPAHGRTPGALLYNAESAMRMAKRLGGNAYRVYQAELQAASSENLRLENELRHAVERNQLALALQPIYDLRTGRVVCGEALLRWNHPKFGAVPPDRFIPLADETGLIHAIGEWVLAQACAEARGWCAPGHDEVAVAVNFSATQFRHERFAERIAAVLRASGLPPQRLEMEITEGAAMQDAEASVETLGELKRMGVRIAIDDFGTGYSSLSYLKRFPIDILKIDRSFMRDVPQDGENVALVRTILGLGRTMRMQLLAEGVETPAQMEFLRESGCDRVQGYLLSKPLAAAEFRLLLTRPGASLANRPAYGRETAAA